jgi:uncharacterized protein
MPTMVKSKSKSNKEVRSYASVKPTLNIRTSNGSKIVRGMAVVYGALSEDLGGWRERIQAGAFTKSLRNNPDVQILNSHNQAQILGRVSSQTATVTDSSIGLRFSLSLGNSSHANDVADMLKRGDVSQCSFGFSCIRDLWELEDDILVRTVQEAQLFELSVVGSPAYSQTSVGLRSALASCPVEFRSKITAKRDDDEQNDCDCDEDDGDCLEECEEERKDNPCENDDEDCHEDEKRQDQLRLRSLFVHRMK